MANRIAEIKELLRGFYTALKDFLKVKIDIPDDDFEIKKQYTSLHVALLLLETYQKGLNWQKTEDIEKRIEQTVRASRLSAIAVLHYLQDIPAKSLSQTGIYRALMRAEMDGIKTLEMSFYAKFFTKVLNEFFIVIRFFTS